MGKAHENPIFRKFLPPPILGGVRVAQQRQGGGGYVDIYPNIKFGV
jgi:hypothetical protein